MPPRMPVLPSSKSGKNLVHYFVTWADFITIDNHRLVRWKLLNEPEDIPILRPPKGADAASVANGSSAHIDETTDKSKDMDQEKGNTKTLPTRAAPSGPSAKATASLFMPKASNSIVRRT